MTSKLASAVIAFGFACATAGQARADSLTVAYYGGSWGDEIKKCIIAPFTAETGVQVEAEPGVSSVTLAKLRQQKGHPAIDVAWMDGGISEIAAGEGLVAPIDPKAVPNVANMIPEGVYKRADGTIFALSTGFYALGIAYNVKDVKPAPASWRDLWNPAYAGAVTLPSPSNAMGVPLLIALSKTFGGTGADVQPALDKLKQLKVLAYFDTSGGADNEFQSGDAEIGAHYAQAVWAMSDKGLPVAYAVPKEGALGGDIRVHVVAGTPRMADAQRFVNEAVSKDAATCMAEALYVGPAAKGITLSEKARQRLPWGADGSVANLALTDWATVNAERARITQEFNRVVAGK